MPSNTWNVMLVAVAALAGQVEPTAAERIAPSTIKRFFNVLTVSKLQAPSSGDNEEDLDGYSSSNFFVQDDKFMRFITDDNEQRSELRIPRGDEFDGGTDDEEQLRGRLRLPATSTKRPGDGEDPDQYTFMQLHAKDRDGPLVRLANYGYRDNGGEVYTDYLWSVVNMDGKNMHQPMIPRPKNDFVAAITIMKNNLVILVGNSERTETVSWKGEECFFKAGSYVQEGPHKDYWVDYKRLLYTGSYAADT